MSATATRFVGQSLKRKEDEPLLRGEGTYVDNIDLPGTVAMVVVRSPYAHARITGIDAAADVSIARIFACACGLRSIAACTMPGRVMSSV